MLEKTELMKEGMVSELREMFLHGLSWGPIVRIIANLIMNLVST